MQEDIPFQLNSLQDEQAVFGVVPIVWEDPSLIIYAIGWSDFEGYMQKWNKTLLRRIIKEDNKAQSTKSEKEKGWSSPKGFWGSEVSFIDNTSSELFDQNLRNLIADIDWDEVTTRLDESLKFEQPQHSSICKI